VLADADTVVIGNSATEFRAIGDALREGQAVIDLAPRLRHAHLRRGGVPGHRLVSDGSAGPGLRLLFLAEGDPENPVKSGSGTPSSVIAHLRRHGAAVASADVDLRGWPRYVAAAATLSRRRAAWVARFHLSRTVLALRSRNARAAARDASPRPDAVLQYGGTFNPSPGGGTPYFLYTDNNVLNSLREPRSWAAQMTRREVDARWRGSASCTRGAAALFMFSDFVGRSFVEDYGLAPERVVRVGCGPNLDVARHPAPPPAAQGGRAPTILFVGRDWENKGGPVVLDASAACARACPTRG
jgi:hypothetical protein